MIEETYIRKRILTDAIKGIEWSGECVCDKGKVYFEMPKDKKEYETCPKCNGTGTAIRPATLQEILEVIVDLVDVTSKTMCKHRLKINNGILRVKESR